MKRTPLSIGSTIQAKGGSSYTYIIDRVIGDGASSIVYEAHYIDSAYGRHDIRLKECYPYASDIQRSGTELVWADSEIAMNDKVAFTTAYHKLLDFQNTTKLRNSTAHIFDLCEANGTLYSVMDVNEGQTFEQDNSEKLSDILKTTLALARVVEKYHNNGYLHLDIKPSNFLVIPETRELVILFDVDSVTAMEDITSGKVKCVSYSKGWAAPEQMQGRIDKLCPATDIYSIGAILFQKVMGRAVENEDIGIFADWNFDGELFERVNPKIKRLLRDIFHKTLAANIKKRYQSVDSLIGALEASVECVRDGAPYLISDCSNPSKNFLGREKELADMASAFNSGKKNVFLHGFGGIGKSELAKKYAELHEKEYDSILFLSYEDSLEDLLDNIQVQNCDAESKNDNVKILKKIFADQRVLLIVDNFDVEIDSDDYLDAFLRLKVDKIFTTRTDFTDIADDKTQQISIENLKSKELVSLFEKESSLSFSDEDRAMIEEILKTFNYYTLIVPILAKQLISSGWSLETLRDKTKQGLRAFEDTEKVAVAKDGRIYRKTGLDMMRATFRMVGLTDVQRRVLTNLYFLRFVKINKEEYRKYLWKENEKRAGHIDAINELANRKWIEIPKPKDYLNNGMLPSSDPYITIHPIIAEMIEIELEPDITASDIAAYVQSYLPWIELKEHLMEGLDDWGPLHQDTLARKLEWFCLFGSSLDLSNANNRDYVVNVFSKLINSNIFVMELIEGWILDKLLDKLLVYLDDEDNNFDVKFKIACLLETKWTRRLSWHYYGDDGEQKEQEIKDNVQYYFDMAHKLSENVSDGLKNDAIVMFCKPIVQYLCQYHEMFSDEIYDIVAENEEKWDHILDGYMYTDWQIDQDVYNQKYGNDNIIEAPTTQKAPDVLDKEKDEEYYYIKKFGLGYPVDDIVDELIEDDRFSNYDKTGIFSDMLDMSVWRRIENFHSYTDYESCSKHKEFLKSVDWTRFKTMAQRYLDYCHTTTFEGSVSDVDFEILTAERYIVVAEAMQGNESELINKINVVTENTIDYINDLDVDDAGAWKSLTQFWDIMDVFKGGKGMYFHLYGIGYYANLFRNLGRSNLVLASLIKCANAIEKKIECHTDMLRSLISTVWASNPSDSEDTLKYDVGESEDPIGLLYNWYRTISEFALNACMEKDITTPDGMRYFNVHTQYFEKALSLVSSGHELKKEEIPFFHYFCQYETISDLCVEYYTQCYFDGMDAKSLNEKIHQDRRLTVRGMLSIYEKIAYEAFFEVDRCWTVKGGYPAVMEYLKTYDWSRLETLLAFQEEYYLDKDEFSSEDDSYEINAKCDMYRALLSAIKEDQESFDEYMGYLWDDFKREFEKAIEYSHWSRFTEFDDVRFAGSFFGGSFITEALSKMQDIEKQKFALPYLINCSELVHTWLKTLPNYTEFMMYNWYKVIAEFAFEVRDAVAVWDEYQRKVDEMTEKNYEISDSNFDD